MEEAIGAVLAWAIVLLILYLFKKLHNYNVSSIEKKYNIGKKDSVKIGVKNIIMEENLKKSIEAMISTYGSGSDPNKFNQLNYERDINLFSDAFGTEATLDLKDKIGLP